jgi:DNA-binding transcriptional ArsR family regulator
MSRTTNGVSGHSHKSVIGVPRSNLDALPASRQLGFSLIEMNISWQGEIASTPPSLRECSSQVRLTCQQPNKTPRSLDLAEPAALFAALGDETRLSLVAQLSQECPLSITRLTDATTVTRQAVTKHLEVLEEAGIVRGARLGREHIWQLEQARLYMAHRYWDMISSQWDQALEKLRTGGGRRALAQRIELAGSARLCLFFRAGAAKESSQPHLKDRRRTPT